VLSLDLASLPDTEIEALIAERCAALGAVERVAVYRPFLPDQFPFALVEMSDPREVEKVARTVGDFIFGRAALVKLAQEPVPASPESATPADATPRPAAPPRRS
jgi:hypothetical protein